MKKSLLLILMLSFNFAPASMAQAEEKFFEDFKNIPVLQEGRIKPLDTYARNLLIQFSGRDTYEHTDAVVWLAKLLFAPANTLKDKVFLINDPEIPVALDIKPDNGRHYSFAQIKDAYPKLVQLQQEAENIDENQRSLAENEILRVAANVQLYIELSSEFLWAWPDADFTITSAVVKQQLGLPLGQNQFSFLEMALRAGQLKSLMMQNQELMAVVNNMFHWAQTYKNMTFSVIPTPGLGWLSPWDAISQDFSDGYTRKLLGLWYGMAMAYDEGTWDNFETCGRLYLNGIKDDLSPQEQKTLRKFPLEIVYQSSRPFMWARVFYISAFIFFIISFAWPNKIWYGLGLMSIVAGFIPHALGLLVRIIIMARPPVTGLYETFIFVSFITVILGFCIEYFNRQWLGIVTAAISGSVLLFIAGKYSAEGDTLKMLVAVLNSNFWLATHVTTITMGYGATCVAGILGHIGLIQAALGKKQEILENTYKTILGIMGVALTLTFLGTNLGGIWADQSWGRFWGWDPKENGALMIVLWLAILFHAKYAMMIDSFGLALGCVIALMVVMWAWFGVNLLSIGLHSYGFTSGIADALIVYAVCEVIFMVTAILLVVRRRQR